MKVRLALACVAIVCGVSFTVADASTGREYPIGTINYEAQPEREVINVRRGEGAFRGIRLEQEFHFRGGNLDGSELSELGTPISAERVYRLYRPGIHNYAARNPYTNTFFASFSSYTFFASFSLPVSGQHAALNKVDRYDDPDQWASKRDRYGHCAAEFR